MQGSELTGRIGQYNREGDLTRVGEIRHAERVPRRR